MTIKIIGPMKVNSKFRTIVKHISLILFKS